MLCDNIPYDLYRNDKFKNTFVKVDDKKVNELTAKPAVFIEEQQNNDLTDNKEDNLFTIDNNANTKTFVLLQ